MRIYIANEGDTLRIIAKRINLSLEELISLNPQLMGSDVNISGRYIKLPSHSIQSGDR